MPLYWIVLLAISMAVSSVVDLSSRAEESSRLSQVSAIAYNLLVYRQALANFAQTNAQTTGAVEDSVLALPSWYSHMPGVEGYVADGVSYTYYPQPPTGLADRLVALTDHSTATGFNNEGLLVSPVTGPTMITLPTAIPHGAVVLYQ